MAVIVVAGGQYGSEGKGKLVSYLACATDGDVAVVRCGGSNAGHTACGHGMRRVLRQIPSGVVSPEAGLYMAAGMLLDLPILLDEIEYCDVSPARLTIDRNAMVVSEADRVAEATTGLRDRIGSTLSGTGYATARKVLREPSVQLASAVPELRTYVGNVSRALNDQLDLGVTVIVEGTQGYGLSLHHADSYPYVTSRDTTASAFLSEVGLSPLSVKDVFLVMRTYPIRVAGHSGPMGATEISWNDVQRRSGYPTPLAEFTSVTRKLRRVAEFDWDLASEAVRLNRPTGLALHGVDYLNYHDYGRSRWDDLSLVSRHFVEELEDRLNVPVLFVFTGPNEGHIVDRRSAFSSSVAVLDKKALVKTSR